MCGELDEVVTPFVEDEKVAGCNNFWARTCEVVKGNEVFISRDVAVRAATMIECTNTFTPQRTYMRARDTLYSGSGSTLGTVIGTRGMGCFWPACEAFRHCDIYD